MNDYDAFNMVPFAFPTSSKMRLHEQHALRRHKYSAARAFYVTIIMVSLFAVWELIDHEEHNIVRKGNWFIRRAGLLDGAVLRGKNSALKSLDLEVSIDWFLSFVG